MMMIMMMMVMMEMVNLETLSRKRVMEGQKWIRQILHIHRSGSYIRFRALPGSIQDSSRTFNISLRDLTVAMAAQLGCEGCDTILLNVPRKVLDILQSAPVMMVVNS